jgi:hypothetical protein
MKKINIFTILVCLISIGANAQLRECDVAVNFHSPKDGDTLTSLKSVDYSFWLINHGPDSLFASDTLAYSLFFNYGPNDSDRTQRPLGVDLASGDSILISEVLNLDVSSIKEKNISILFYRRASLRSIADSKRILRQEVHPGTQNNIDQVDLIYLNPSVSVPEVEELDYNIFPNPVVAGSKLTISSSHSNENTKVYLKDIQGRILDIKDSFYDSNKGTVIDVSSELHGLYFLVITNGEFTYTHKLLVQ